MRVPLATYRLQFHPGVGFSQARKLLPYLQELGISDLYASPLFSARRGSLHGYSVTNPLELNRELGSKVAFDTLVHHLQDLGMGLLLDIVPNHMALSPDNPWWMEVLECGPASPYAAIFDIDWQHASASLHGKVLLPVLGHSYAEILENRELVLALGPKGFHARYYDLRFPLDPKTYQAILTHDLKTLERDLGSGNPAFLGLLGLITMVEHLPDRTAINPRKLRERQRQKELLKERLWLLYQGSPEIKAFIDRNLEAFNGSPGLPESFDLLDDLLVKQPYRLAHWKVALELINYRRFFSINDLIGIRVEDPQVFTATHELLLRLAAEGKITGLRIDHIDGLVDPQGYLTLLSRSLAAASTEPAETGTYIIVEKILARGETLPGDWPVAGTTGYDFLGLISGLFVDPQGLQDLEDTYVAFTGRPRGFADLVYQKKKLVMQFLFGGEVRALGHELAMLAGLDRYAKDLSLLELTSTLLEVTACLPVYRTYIRRFEVPARDAAYLETAISQAARYNPGLNPVALKFFRRVLFVDLPPSLPADKRDKWLQFVRRWQQFTGPIMAKGLEDTTLYIYNPLVSLNDVGSDFHAVSLAEFHRFNQERLAHWPHSLNASSTHDTKRSEDVRARLHLLSEIPQDWGQALERWGRWNQRLKTMIGGKSAPDSNEEILFYQTLLGAYPLSETEVPGFRERLQAYMLKAIREAKINSRWTDPHTAYEQAVTGFVEAVLRPAPENAFLADFQQFHQRLAHLGALNSLAHVLLKITSPGVPDLYQGTELWDFSLVDPDNRRPVDFPLRRRLLRALKKQAGQNRPALISDLLNHWQDGRLKLFVTQQALHFRQNASELFQQGAYLPLTASPPRGEHLVAFARSWQGAWTLVLVPRLLIKLASGGAPPCQGEVWGASTVALPPDAPRAWKNIFTEEILRNEVQGDSETLSLAAVFQRFPVALLAGSA